MSRISERSMAYLHGFRPQRVVAVAVGEGGSASVRRSGGSIRSTASASACRARTLRITSAAPIPAASDSARAASTAETIRQHGSEDLHHLPVPVVGSGKPAPNFSMAPVSGQSLNGAPFHKAPAFSPAPARSARDRKPPDGDRSGDCARRRRSRPA